MYSDYSKSQKKALRELAAAISRREMDSLLSELYELFQQWKNEELSPFDLQEKIHACHQNEFREHHEVYTGLKPDFIVVRGLLKNLARLDELPEDIREEFANKVEVFKMEI